jgi:hypothetical protein
MRKQDGLGMLHVGHARHRNLQVRFGLGENGVKQGMKSASSSPTGLDDEKTELGRHQIIAAAARVQLPSERAEFLDERLFYEVMDVFGGGPELIDPRGLAFRALRDFLERGNRLLHLTLGQDAGSLQGLGPSAVDRNFVG